MSRFGHDEDVSRPARVRCERSPARAGSGRRSATSRCTRTARAASAALGCGLLACVAGCTSLPWQKVPLDVASGFYSDAALTYRLDAAKLGQPLDVVRVESQRVSYEQVASSPMPDESVGTLTIRLPHPLGRPGLALAQFTLTSNRAKPSRQTTGWSPFVNDPDAVEAPTAIVAAHPQVYESWELDIPRGEVDQILKLLNGEGFYHSQRTGPARVAVKMDGVRQEKEWSEIPALNLLIQRVRSAGRLTAYSRPTASDGSPVSTIASTGAYADLWARGGMPDAPRSSVASAFSMPGAPAGPVPGRVAPAYPATPYPATVAQRGPATTR